LKADADVAMLGSVGPAVPAEKRTRRRFRPRALTRALPLGADLASTKARVIRGGTLAVAITWTVYAVYVGLIQGSSPTLDTAFKTWLFSAILLASAAVCGLRAAWIRADRLAWSVLSIGMGLWALATVVWSIFYADLEAPPFPSVADGLYLSFYPAAYIALMPLVRRQLRGVGPSVWLDGLIGALSVGAIGAAFVIPSILADTGGSVAAVATNAAYPLGDLLLCALVAVMFALTGWRPGRTWLLIGGGLVLFAVADSLYLYRVAQGTFVEGTFLDALWPAGMLLVSLSAWQIPREKATHTFEGWAVVLVPSLFTLGSLGVLLYGDLGGTNPYALGLASGAVVASLFRLGLSFREVQSLAQSRRQATTDELTGLANRRLLYERLEKAIVAGRRANEPVALLVADLDGFKELNDTLGHHAGDLLLKQVGPRMLDVLGKDDTLARLGGDEFAVLMPGQTNAEVIEKVERVQSAIDRAFTVRGLTVHIEASIGVANFPEHAQSADELVQRADVAMYQAKESRTGFETYAPERDVHSRDRLSLLGELRKAIETSQLVLHYQPKGDLVTGEVDGVEALVRWEHPERGLLPPGEFIPLAEQTALMRPLTLYVLENSLKQVRTWRNEGIELNVAVNLSVPNLLDVRLPDDVARLLEQTGVPASFLQLEVTENIIMADPVRVIEVLDRLKALGIRLSLDDFGTGSSSLSYLKHLPLDELKIDRSFVIAMSESEPDAVIVRSTAELAQRLGLRVVAEGVETPEAWQQLADIGCEQAQGYYLQRPLEATDFIAWLRERRTNAEKAATVPASTSRTDIAVA
jgi:diguanylate cyclase (GGDEF)-like protein